MPAEPSADYTESPYYLQAVAALARRQTVTAHEDIYCDNGIKLVSKGTELGEEQFQRLARHKLHEPLDNMLISERAIDAASLSIEAGKILEHDPIYARLANRSGDPLAVKHGLAALKLPPPLLMRLTVLRDQRQEMFQHTLRTAIIAYALAQRLKLPPPERQVLLLAALCHDLGEMHTDPMLLDSGHAITPDERRYVHVHPLASHMVLNAIKDFPPAARQAVLQHHERMDGSGYPHGLRADKITPLAKLLAVADVAETVIRRFDLPRLDMLARLHQNRFDRAAADALRDLIHATPEDALPMPQEQLDAATKLAHLSDVLRAWFAQRSVFEHMVAPAEPERSPLAFLFERMNTIRQLVLQAGFDPDRSESMLFIAQDDPAILLELRTMLDEIEWLQLDLANEIDRRSAELQGLSPQPLHALLQHLRPG
ncbi:HD domain-containing protein [Pseudoduganella sp. FT55W]|uniref:HD domain-containing protein n=1 Tax=Duganella rivi TaxID=2666083 RepID=A0A7X4K9U3_9BURK|nr:HD domain-containing phosphohydrolase [Duganella rivi]MYM65257.1 HD domain-containing protein [Duganella rivi]